MDKFCFRKLLDSLLLNFLFFLLFSLQYLHSFLLEFFVVLRDLEILEKGVHFTDLWVSSHFFDLITDFL